MIVCFCDRFLITLIISTVLNHFNGCTINLQIYKYYNDACLAFFACIILNLSLNIRHTNNVTHRSVHIALITTLRLLIGKSIPSIMYENAII